MSLLHKVRRFCLYTSHSMTNEKPDYLSNTSPTSTTTSTLCRLYHLIFSFSLSPTLATSFHLLLLHPLRSVFLFWSSSFILSSFSSSSSSSFFFVSPSLPFLLHHQILTSFKHLHPHSSSSYSLFSPSIYFSPPSSFNILLLIPFFHMFHLFLLLTSFSFFPYFSNSSTTTTSFCAAAATAAAYFFIISIVGKSSKWTLF